MTDFDILRPRFLLLLVLVPAVVAAWRHWPPPLSRARSGVALGLRLALLLLLVLSLADVRVARSPEQRAVVAVVDLSDSARASRDDATAAVRAMLDAKGPDDLFGVVTFGSDAQVEVPPSREPDFDGFQTRPEGTFSNLDGALQLAANLIPDGYARQVVLVSDGRQNLGDAASAVSALEDRSVRVDVVPIGRPPGAEVLVAALDAPNELREGESLSISARLRSTTATTGRLSFQMDGREVEARNIDIPAGESSQTIDFPPIEPGIHRMRAVIEASPDGYSQNNVSEAVVRVLGRPSVLLLEGAAGAGANVRTGLEAAGMTIETRRSRDTPTDAAVLAKYDSTVIVDAPAESFPDGGMAAIATSVRDLGHGLVAIGGPRSFGPGGWKDTPLEEALPVRMEIPRPKERPAVGLAIALETMETPFGDGVALGAAGNAIDQLTPEDEIAVLNMGGGGDRTGPRLSGAGIIVPLGRVVDKAGIKRAIGATTLGDPPGYAESMHALLDSLSGSTAAVKQAIVIGDGDATGGIPEYDAVFARARQMGVIVSAIGVDTHFDAASMDHMRNIAERGGGIFYMSDSADEVPDILLEATRTSLRPWFEQNPFFPEVTSSSDLLAGVPLDAFPELGGYVVTTPKSTADVALSSPKTDPLLAAGQYGLGRSVAWTSDADGRWTSGFLSSPVSATLFGRMVAWSLPTGNNGELKVDATPQGNGLQLTVSGPQEGGDLQIRAIGPDGESANHQLRPVEPGVWEGTVPASQIGTYVLHSVLRRGGAAVAQSDVSIPVPYSPEFLEFGRDDGLLTQLAARTGIVLTEAGSVWSQKRLPLTVTSPIFWLLVLLTVVAWPIDVALRRLTLSPLKVLALARAARAVKRKAAGALPEHVGALRQGMEARRRRGNSDVDQAHPTTPERTREPVTVGAKPTKPGPGASGPTEPSKPAPTAGTESDLSARLLAARRERDEKS